LQGLRLGVGAGVTSAEVDDAVVEAGMVEDDTGVVRVAKVVGVVDETSETGVAEDTGVIEAESVAEGVAEGVAAEETGVVELTAPADTLMLSRRILAKPAALQLIEIVKEPLVELGTMVPDNWLH
jgi:hypothetical protein